MSQHTKGPWSQGKRGPNGCPIIGNGRGLMVAMLAHSANEPGQEEEAECNAKLIAELPELYELLSEVMSCVGPRELKDIFGYDWYRRASAALSRIEI